MRQYCVVSLFSSVSQARLAQQILGSAHIGDEDISFITHGESQALKELQAGNQNPAGGNNTSLAKDTGDEPVASRTIGGAVAGGAVAAPFALGTAVFPLFIAGPLLAAALGGILGAMADAEKAAELKGMDGLSLEESLRRGAVLIAVTGEESIVEEAHGLLITCDPVWVKMREMAPIE